MIKQKFVGFEI